MVGAHAAIARDVADSIVAWRTRLPSLPDGTTKRMAYEISGLNYSPSNHSFDDLEEVGLVVGMTPALFAAVRPFLTVYTAGNIQLADANPLLVQAVQFARDINSQAAASGFTDPDLVALIHATADSPDARFMREAVVRLKARPRAKEAPYQVLSWADGTPPPLDVAPCQMPAQCQATATVTSLSPGSIRP